MDIIEKDPLSLEMEDTDQIMECDLSEQFIAPLVPVVIEELNEASAMNINMAEFKETNPIHLDDISMEDEIENLGFIEINETDSQSCDLNISEYRVTNEFLRGNISFSEYSTSMDNEVEFESIDLDTRSDTSEKVENKFKSTVVRKKRTLPAALLGLLGEANLRFVKGEIDMAARICYEIIRQVPSAPEPFQLLASIYKDDQPEKSLQFSLIAAHLSPKDADQWVRLAEMSLTLEKKNIKQAITCYSKAINASPKDVSLYEARAELQEMIGDKKAAFRGFIKLLSVLGPEDAPIITKYAKILAKQFIRDNNYEQALQAMENFFTKCPDSVEPSDVNIMVEILISLKQFYRSLDILTQYTNICVVCTIGPTSEAILPADVKDQVTTEPSKYIKSCKIPSDVPVDLKAKCLVALIELNEIHIAEPHLPNIYQKENPEISGDLFLDIAEALMSKKQFLIALNFLEPLICSVHYNLAAIWLRYAECWLGLKDVPKAISSFERVRELAPRLMEARIELGKLYEGQNLMEQALAVLYQEPEIVEFYDATVLLRRTNLLLKCKKYNEFFESAMFLFSRHCILVKSREEVTALTRATCFKMRLECLQMHRLSRAEKLNDVNSFLFKEQNPPFEEEFKLFLNVCDVAYKLKRYRLMQKFCFSLLTSKIFDCKAAYIMFLCLISSIYANDSYHGFNIVRDVVRLQPTPNYCNLLNIIIQRAEDSRHNRYIMRLLVREGIFSPLYILHANNCLVAGTYKYALNDYISLFKSSPDALTTFLIAVTQLQIASQKFASRKSQTVIQAFAFLQKYSKIRGEGMEQEVAYNLGRAFHQIGLLPAAMHYYKQVLAAKIPKMVQDHSEILDLKREAAFNLHLIYLQSDNKKYASMYLQHYITV